MDVEHRLQPPIFSEGSPGQTIHRCHDDLRGRPLYGGVDDLVPVHRPMTTAPRQTLDITIVIVEPQYLLLPMTHALESVPKLFEQRSQNPLLNPKVGSNARQARAIECGEHPLVF